MIQVIDGRRPDDGYRRAYGRLMRLKRRRRGLSRRELARLAFVELDVVRQIERGTMVAGLIYRINFVMLCSAMGLRIDEVQAEAREQGMQEMARRYREGGDLYVPIREG